MNIKLDIGVRLKWFLISLGMMFVGWLLGNTAGWDEGFGLLGVFVIVFATMINFGVIIAWISHDFKWDEGKSIDGF